MSKTHRHTPSDPVKALKRATRDEFGFEPTRISKNQKKYSRSREKRSWMIEEDFSNFYPARA